MRKYEYIEYHLPFSFELVDLPLDIISAVLVEPHLPIDISVEIEAQLTTAFLAVTSALNSVHEAGLTVHALIVIDELFARLDVSYGNNH